MGSLNNSIILAKAARAIISSIAIALFCHAQTSFSSSPACTQQATHASPRHSQSCVSAGANSQSNNKQSGSKNKYKCDSGKARKNKLSRTLTRYLNRLRTVLWGQHGWNTHYLRRLVTLGSAVISASAVKDVFAVQTHSNQQQSQLEPPVVLKSVLSSRLPSCPELSVQPNNGDIKEEKEESEAERIEREQKERIDRAEALVEARKQRRVQRDDEQERLNAELDAKLLEQQQDAQQKDVERQARRAALKRERESLPTRFMQAILDSRLEEAARLITDEIRVEMEPRTGDDQGFGVVRNMREEHAVRCKRAVNKGFVDALKSTIDNMSFYEKERTWTFAALSLTAESALKYVNGKMPAILRAVIPAIEMHLPKSPLSLYDETSLPQYVPVSFFKIAIKLDNVAMADALLESCGEQLLQKHEPQFGMCLTNQLDNELAILMMKHDCMEMLGRVSKRGFPVVRPRYTRDVCEVVDNGSSGLVTWLIEKPDTCDTVWYHAVASNNQKMMGLVLSKPEVVNNFNHQNIYSPIFKTGNIHAMKMLLDRLRATNVQVDLKVIGNLNLLDNYLFGFGAGTKFGYDVDKFMLKLLIKAGVRPRNGRRRCFSADGKSGRENSTVYYVTYAPTNDFSNFIDTVKLLFAERALYGSPITTLSLLCARNLTEEIQDFIFDGGSDNILQDTLEDACERMSPDRRLIVLDAERRRREARRILLEQHTKKQGCMPRSVIGLIEEYCLPGYSSKLREALPFFPRKVVDIIQEYEDEGEES